MRFTAVDVETSNPSCSSICRIGVVCFENGVAVQSWQAYVDPEDYFHPWCVSIHGVTEDDVREAPTFPQIVPMVDSMIGVQVAVCHTAFDRVSIRQARAKYCLPEVACTWLDSARVVRRTWPRYSRSGYGLQNVAGDLGIAYEPHIPVEDARAAGEILLRAIRETGLTLEDWLVRVNQPISSDAQSTRAEPIAREGNPNGPLHGEVIVFTGSLSLSRRQAATMAAELGCTVAESVNKSTTLLVVGNQDLRYLAGNELSSKHRKAEGLIAKGRPIRILGESDFFCLVDQDRTTAYKS